MISVAGLCSVVSRSSSITISADDIQVYGSESKVGEGEAKELEGRTDIEMPLMGDMQDR